jgi:hypothetical protein
MVRNALYLLAGCAVGLAVLRRIMDGPGGELVAAAAGVCACILLGAGAIVDAIHRRGPPPPG